MKALFQAFNRVYAIAPIALLLSGLGVLSACKSTNPLTPDDDTSAETDDSVTDDDDATVIAEVTAGTLTATTASASSVNLSWTAATDSSNPSGTLEYKVIKGLVTSSIDSIDEANAITGADLVMDWTAITTSTSATGLSASTAYVFAVLVKNSAGLIALYDVATATTSAAPPLQAICYSPSGYGFPVFDTNAATCVEMKAGIANRAAFGTDCTNWGGTLVEDVDCEGGTFDLVAGGGNASDTSYCTANDTSTISWTRIFAPAAWTGMAQSSCASLSVGGTWH